MKKFGSEYNTVEVYDSVVTVMHVMSLDALRLT